MQIYVRKYVRKYVCKYVQVYLLMCVLLHFGACLGQLALRLKSQGPRLC